MNGINIARTELDKVSSLVQTAHRHVMEGNLVDLSALESRMKTIICLIEALPAEERPALSAEVEALLRRLDDLEKGLTECLERTRAQLGEG